MSSSETGLAIRARDLGKCYHIYERPQDRLKQYLRRSKQYYREFWANRGISFEVPKGATCGIVGRNGAGKTTLLQMIAGTLHPTEGELEVQGRVTALLELGSGFNADFTGRENVFLSGALLGLKRRQVEERFDRIAAFADIGDFLDQPVKTYSSGMFMRLAFSVLANMDPEVFIVDEALAVGDAYFRHRCMRRFHEMREAGTTILYVSHDAGSMKRLCDQVLWLGEGQVVEQGEPSGVVDRYLASLFELPTQAAEAGRDESGETGPGSEAEAEDPSGAAPLAEVERNLPGGDARLGDGRCRLLGLGIYDETGRSIQSISSGETLRVRISFQNEDLPEDATALRVGYILRNPGGEDLASTNSHTEGVGIDVPPRGGICTVRFDIQLPHIPGGAYSLSPAVAYERREGPVDTKDGVQVADRVDNALVFAIVAERLVHSMIALPTSISVETAEDGAC